MPTNKKTTTTKETQDAKIEVTTKVKGSKHIRKPNVTVLLDTDDLVREQFGGFVNFLRENGVVALAIGFVAGSQAQAVVKALIADFIDPASKLFFGGVKLSDRTFTQHFHGRWTNFHWGDLVYTLLNLLFVLGTIYFIIRVFKLDRLQKPKS
jgi:large-conductance mechanosensitive channel